MRDKAPEQGDGDFGKTRVNDLKRLRDNGFLTMAVRFGGRQRWIYASDSVTETCRRRSLKMCAPCETTRGPTPNRLGQPGHLHESGICPAPTPEKIRDRPLHGAAGLFLRPPQVSVSASDASHPLPESREREGFGEGSSEGKRRVASPQVAEDAVADFLAELLSCDRGEPARAIRPGLSGEGECRGAPPQETEEVANFMADLLS